MAITCVATQSLLLLLPNHITFPSSSTSVSNISLPPKLNYPRIRCDGRSSTKVKVGRRVGTTPSAALEVEGTGRSGIWSIRDDLAVPSSPYLPVYAQGQMPSLMVYERFQGVITQLFQYRIIRCGGPIDDDMANIIVAQLLYLDAIDPTKDIVMYINSPGGSVTAGMAVFDTMRHIRPNVSTVCVGLAASMGAFILSAGTKGKRYSLPNARMMIHQPLADISGSRAQIEIQTNEVLHHLGTLSGYLAYHTGKTYDQINSDIAFDFFMSATEAVDYGLIDGIITNPFKGLTPPVAAAASPDESS